MLICPFGRYIHYKYQLVTGKNHPVVGHVGPATLDIAQETKCTYETIVEFCYFPLPCHYLSKIKKKELWLKTGQRSKNCDNIM